MKNGGRPLHWSTVVAVMLGVIGLGFVVGNEAARPTPPPITGAKEADSTEIKERPKMKPAPIVFVTGAVKNPGPYSFSPGNTVADAIEAAGGVLPNARLVRLNLKEELRDNQAIYVWNDTDLPADLGTGAMNINEADAKELATLPGIGDTLAARIVEHRQKNYGILDFDQLLEVEGLTPKILEKIRPLIHL